MPIILGAATGSARSTPTTSPSQSSRGGDRRALPGGRPLRASRRAPPAALTAPRPPNHRGRAALAGPRPAPPRRRSRHRRRPVAPRRRPAMATHAGQRRRARGGLRDRAARSVARRSAGRRPVRRRVDVAHSADRLRRQHPLRDVAGIDRRVHRVAGDRGGGLIAVGDLVAGVVDRALADAAPARVGEADQVADLVGQHALEILSVGGGSLAPPARPTRASAC